MSTPSPTPTPTPTPDTQVPTPTPPAEVKPEARILANYVPANWNIRPVEGGEEDQIEARNNVTNKFFEGTVAEFNKFLRGE